MLVAFWVLLILIPIVFTWWGWKNVIIPYGFPLGKVLFTLILVVVWVGFCSAVMASPVWYRTFGWNSFTVMAGNDDNKYAHKIIWEQENSTTPDGEWQPGWRESSGLPPLSPSWRGNPPPQHRLPGWTAILIPLSILGFMSYRNGLLVKILKAKPKTRSMPEMADLIRSLRPVEPRQPVVDVTPVQPKVDNDADFKAALKDLGYKAADINEVAKQCTEPDIESRIRHALKILVNK